ncbi:MAG TPA: thiamine phosphate synthase [Candidatus Acidoferrales bacterium]|nr:thiamine phosphate synthase [Candidatus Acidoferrales bacterium]
MFPALYAILDPQLISTPLVPFAQNLAAAGVSLIQLRDKRATTARLCAQSRELAAVLCPAGVRFIVNDRPDIAVIAGASGVHVGQDDLPPEDARSVVGPSRWVGVSTHNLTQFREANATSADYIAVGPIFPTASKENPDPVVGLELLREVRKLTTKPLVAIGGITLERAPDVFRAGADSVAVIRDLLCADNPAERAREYLAVAAQATAERSRV